MDINNFPLFLKEVFSNMPLLITVVLILAVILVNGWTDAPNAIATVVSTRALSPRNAILMATVFNFLGVFVMTLFQAEVAQTIYNMVDFGNDPKLSIVALCAALVAIVTWATAAWYFGIPTSESHALIAGISGAAIALQGSIAGINGAEWMKVIYGIFISTGLGFGFGYLIAKLITMIFRGRNRQRSNRFFTKGQIFGGASMAFMHGAQDGQKFMGVFLLGVALAKGDASTQSFSIPLWLMVLSSLTMALGTSIGGMRIIKSVGMDMVSLSVHEGFAADLAAASALLFTTVFGIPVSTTHTKTTAIMGVGVTQGSDKVNWKLVLEMVMAWVLTFPGCGLIGFGMAKIFIKLFT
ncbi:MAG: inorganic phosphate transporter [Erysipelothrix sp.]|nr:inorganic phosphate transporter [Erysipelothrix sp.]